MIARDEFYPVPCHTVIDSVNFDIRFRRHGLNHYGDRFRPIGDCADALGC